MIKNRLKEIRCEKEFISQKDFASFLGINKHQYSKYERNVLQPNLETAFKICIILDLDIKDIFYLE
ncbi:helix-turn-helix transcriptional regulator [Tepidibacter formicigenes]|uniref:DNA-binding transcriptional regulator, XRE-family HTH domain n=1 Tax=Tepidibacter formicigenes DSM 15518 TaxID=1123349 RepID=A0A1M6JYL9_9FIRM|nr:helix-turn-helix domain-containing protein [Tepidibacter formicigenes]SHJ51732.1 DNA-binding transcriptional regulator, XRE-family HTH domain [Tepidibacter formicigenes DSM 15518]